MVVIAQVNLKPETAAKVPRTPPVVRQPIDEEGGQQLHPCSLADGNPCRSADTRYPVTRKGKRIMTGDGG